MTFVIMPNLRELKDKEVKQIIRLSKRINPNASRHDNRKHKYFSIREIAVIMKISHRGVEDVLNRFKEKDGISKD